MVLFDTNFIIYLLKKEAKATSAFQTVFQCKTLAVSFITKIELLSFHNLSPHQEKEISDFLDLVDVIYINDAILNTTIDLRKKLSIKTPDAIIAATALQFQADLFTRNVKDFKNIDALQLIEI